MITKKTFKNFEDYAKVAGPQSWKRLSNEFTKEAREKYKQAVDVYIVDGDWVRSNINVDYVEGGHEAVYDYITKGEIWVEDMEDKKEMWFNFQHELYERSLMIANPKMSYDTAHDKAVQRETKQRHKLDPKYTGQLKTNVGSNI